MLPTPYLPARARVWPKWLWRLDAFAWGPKWPRYRDAFARMLLVCLLGEHKTLAADHDSIEVVVTDTRDGARSGPRDASVASSVVSSSSLVAPGLQTEDVLRTQTGVAASASGGLGSPTFVSVRGGNAPDTSVYLAGVRLNDELAGSADLSMVSLWLLDHVEIYRGHAPLEADRWGPGGAIFFEPKRPTKNMGGVGYQGGSWGTSRGWMYQGSRSAGLSYLWGISADRASNRYPFVNDRGMLLSRQPGPIERRSNADQHSVDSWFLGRLEVGRGFTLDGLVNVAYREQGIPRLAVLPSERARQSRARELASITLRGPLDPARTLRFEARTSYTRGNTHFTDPWRELALRADDVDIVEQRFDQTVALGIEPTPDLRIRSSVTGEQASISRQPNDIPIGRAHRESARIANAVEFRPLSRWILRGLMGFECHHTGVTDRLCASPTPTGRIGSEFDWDNLRLYTNLGRYVRQPSLGELYGASATVHGNPELLPESGHTLELGMRLKAHFRGAMRSAYLDAFGYSRWVDRLVNYTRTGEGFVRPYNVGRARILGAEVSAGATCRRLCSFEVALTAMDPRNTTEGRTTVNAVLPYRARLVAAPRANLDWQRSSPNGLSGAGGRVIAFYQSSRFADPAGLALVEPQFTVDVDAYVAWFDGLLSMRGRVADLFDAKRTDLVGYPLPGRSVYLGIEARI